MPQERNSIGVRVRPNADQFIADLRTQMAAKKFTFYANVEADTKRATADVQTWAKTRLKSIPATVNVGANLSPATGDLRAWRATQRKIKTNIPIGVDLSAANRDMKVWREAIGRPLEIKIKSDVGGLRSIEAARKSIKRDLDQLSLFDVEPTVKPKTAAAEAEVKEFTKRASKDPIEKKLDLDLKEARLRLLGLKAEALASKMVVKVDVETSKFDAFQKRLKQLTFGSGSRKGGPLSFNIPGPLGTISAPGGLAGIVALGAATPAAVIAVASLSKALIDLAGAAALVPGAIAVVGASIATLAVGTQGVGEAFKAMFDLWKEGSDAQQSQVKGLVTAHNSYKTALGNEATAQRNVSQARQNALNDLRNLHNELRRGSLNEAQAILNVQKAADTLAKGGFQTQTDYTQALLDQANAEADLVDVRERNNQLRQKGNQENAKGVEGSDQVVAALQAQSQAADATAAALQAISDTSAAGATSKFSDALAQLSPNARDFIEQINGSKGALHGFKDEIQDIIFQGAGAGFKNFFGNLEPIIRPGMKEIAEGLNKNLLQVFDSLSSPGGKSIIERILGGTAESQKALTGLIDPLIRGVGTLAAAGAEKLPALIDLFTRLADRFANFIEGADKSGALDAFFDRGIKAMEQLVDIGVNLFKIINDLGKSFGGDLLQSLVNVTDRLHNFLASDAGQERLKKWIKEAGELWDDWKPALEQLPELISRLSAVATQALNVLSPILSGILTALEKAPILVEAFAVVWGGNKMLGALSTVAKLGKSVADIVGNLAKIPKAISSLPTVGAGGAPGGPVATAGGVPGALATTAAAVPFIAAVGGFLAAGSALYNAAPDDQKKVAGTNITTGDLGNARTGGRGTSANQGANDQANAERLLKAGKPPPFGSAPYDFLVKSVKEGKFAQQYPYITVGNDGHLVDNRNGQVLPGFGVGGFTNWPQDTGKMAMLHGKEYIQPADTVSHYGVGAMKAVHEKRVPKGMLQSFQGGGYFDPTSGQWVPEGAAPSQHGVTAAAVDPGVPGAGGGPGGIIPTIVGGATGIAQNFASQAIGAIQSGQGLGPAPGPGAVGIGAGAGLPGLNIPGLPANPNAGTPMNFNLFGINIPLGNAPVNKGWGDAGPPPGLGGGPPGPNGQFDIRNYGIGPGPPGSGPADWAQEIGKIGGNFLSGTASALAEGFFGGLGLTGLGTYTSDAAQIGQHFIPKPGEIQAPGAGDASAQALADIGQYYNTPDNPAFPGLPPGVAAPGNVAIGTTATTGKRGEGSGVIAAADAAKQKIIDASRAPNAQVLPNANVVAFMRTVGAKFNLHPGAEGVEGGDPYRTSESTSQHTVGRGMDLYGTEADRARFVQWWESNPDFLAATRQIIFGQNPSLDAYGGTIRDVYGAKTNAQHLDHVHFALEGVPAVAAGIDWGTTIPGVTNADKQLGPHIALGPRRGGPTSTFTQWGVPRQGGSDIKSLAQFLYAQAGLPQNEWGAFDQLIQHESGWDPKAKNPGSTAFGLGQFLDTTQKQYGITGSTDPAKQLMAIFSYLKNRADYKGSPAAAWSLWQSRSPHWYDQGGWLMPGATTTVNATGHPELILPPAASASFLEGGFNFFKPPTAAVPSPGPIPPAPQVPARTLQPKPPPSPPPTQTAPAAPKAPVGPPAPSASPPSVSPGKAGDIAPPSAPTVPVAPAPPSSHPPAVGGVTPATVTPGIDPADKGMHVHPALEKGITSGAKAIGMAASTAISVAASAAGSSGFAPGAGAAGAIGPYVAGLIEQGGKIIKNIANVPSSFLVGSATGGTTQNPYGATQRSSNPGGGTTIDQSHHGDVYTQNLDDYFQRVDIRNAQRAQGILGRFG